MIDVGRQVSVGDMRMLTRSQTFQGRSKRTLSSRQAPTDISYAYDALQILERSLGLSSLILH